MKKVIAPSKNIDDQRDMRARPPIDYVQPNPEGQKQTAKALGLDGAAADLQNTANKMVAVRRTRMAGVDLPEDILLKRMQR